MSVCRSLSDHVPDLAFSINVTVPVEQPPNHSDQRRRQAITTTHSGTATRTASITDLEGRRRSNRRALVVYPDVDLVTYCDQTFHDERIGVLDTPNAVLGPNADG